MRLRSSRRRTQRSRGVGLQSSVRPAEQAQVGAGLVAALGAGDRHAQLGQPCHSSRSSAGPASSGLVHLVLRERSTPWPAAGAPPRRWPAAAAAPPTRVRPRTAGRQGRPSLSGAGTARARPSGSRSRSVAEAARPRCSYARPGTARAAGRPQRTGRSPRRRRSGRADGHPPAPLASTRHSPPASSQRRSRATTSGSDSIRLYTATRTGGR